MSLTYADAQKLVERAINKDPYVKFMVEKLEEAGCKPQQAFIRVENCEQEVGGGFRPPDGVRAANLSGDCWWKQEMLRGNLGIRAQHKACVRRRAELSVGMNPYCGGAKARAAVDAVFDTCFKDTQPFDRIP